MKNLLSLTLAATLSFSAATAYAGGPVVIVDEPEVVAEKPRSGALLPLLLVGVVLCVALCGGDDEDEGRRIDIGPIDPIDNPIN